LKGDTIIGRFLNSAELYSDDIAFAYFDGSWKTVTYRDFLKCTEGIASHLMKTGIKNGDRVAILSENRFEWCVSYLGILMAGGVAVPIDAQLGPDEVGNLLLDSRAVFLFQSEKTAENVRVTVKTMNLDSDEFREECGIAGDTSQRLRPSPFGEDRKKISEEDLASILYTSGTTGNPKGVMLSHRNFCSDAEAAISAGIVTRGDNVLSILPLHHTYSFMCTFLVPVFLGATITYPLGMKGPELISTMKDRGVTILIAVPQILELMRNGILRRFQETPAAVAFSLRALLNLCGRLRGLTGLNLGKWAFGSVRRAFGARFRFFACGGARLDPSVMKDLEALGFTVLEGYGLTETSPIVTFNPLAKRKPGSAGKPLPSVEIKIVSPSEAGEGEIAIRGPMVMRGYYRNPVSTAEVVRDGWFMSGDLGYLDGENYLFITGRVKEVIVLSSGKNVYPEDVERAYLKIPLIKELCVTHYGARGGAASLHGIIVPDLDCARKERIGNIHESLRSAINGVSMKQPPYARLKGFTLYPGPLPRTPLGKLKRHMIRGLLDEKRAKNRESGGEDPELLRDEIGRVVAECISRFLKEQQTVRMSDSLELDLGFDSLQRVELVVALERAFSLKLPETFASTVQTVGELVASIKEFALKGSAEREEKPFWKDVFAEEPTDEERARIGLGQGRIEWSLIVVLLAVLRVILRSIFRFEVRGSESLPASPFIIAPNHCSNMDGFVVGSAVPEDIFKVLYFQGYQKYFTGRLLSLFARLAHVIPIDPETFLGKAFQLSSYVLRNGRSLCIFPEGGRSPDGTLMEFKKGIGILAVEHNIPVVPVLIEGTFRALPRGALWPRIEKIRLTFGNALYPSEMDFTRKPEGTDDYQFFSDEIRERVRTLRGERA